METLTKNAPVKASKLTKGNNKIKTNIILLRQITDNMQHPLGAANSPKSAIAAVTARISKTKLNFKSATELNREIKTNGLAIAFNKKSYKSADEAVKANDYIQMERIPLLVSQRN